MGNNESEDKKTPIEFGDPDNTFRMTELRIDRNRASGGPVEPGFYRLGRGDEKEAFRAGNANHAEPIKTDDKDFGKRLRAVLENLPDEMKNDPAYADPVAWVKRARENNCPPITETFGEPGPLMWGFFQLNPDGTSEIQWRPGIVVKRADVVPLEAIGVTTVSDGKGGEHILEVSITDPVYAAKLRESMSDGAQRGMSIGYQTDKPPMVVQRNAVQLALGNARALVRRLFRR